MIKQNWHMIAALLAVGGWLSVGPMVACGPEKKEAECASTLDCSDGQACVEEKCVARGELGDSCEEGKEPGCVDGLICDKSECKSKCTTDFDCDKGEECNTTTGACQTAQKEDAGPVDEGPGQGIGEDCNPKKCNSELTCVKWTDNASKCWKTCTENKDCADGRVCSGGYCVPTGEKCQYDTPGGKLTIPCYTGLECVLTGPVEGVCSQTCTKDEDCLTGESCVEQTNGKKTCGKAGDKAGPGQACGTIDGKKVDCVDGYGCVEKGLGSTDKVCTKTCTKSEDCQWPKFCQSNFCVDGNVGTVKLGEVCSTKSDATEAEKCAAGHYCFVVKQGETSGICLRDCTDARADQCPTGTECVSTTATIKTCLTKCTKPEDCSAPTPECGKLTNNEQVCIPKAP